MKLLLDQGLPRRAAQLLTDAGIPTIHTSEVGLATARDADILSYARKNQCTVVTLDSDFHTLLAISNAKTPSVIRIRIQRLRAEHLLNLLIKVVDDWSKEIESGVMLTINSKNTRWRKLPLIDSISE